MKWTRGFLSGLMLSAASGVGVAAEPLEVSAGIPPVAWLVEQVGGEQVRVHAFLEAGDDPHTFEARPSQVREFARARLFFSIGLPFERVLSERLGGAARIVDAARGIEKLETSEGHHDHGHGTREEHAHEDHHHEHADGDPHVWLDPLRAIAVSANIRDTLSQADPAHADLFAQAQSNLEKRLLAMHHQLEQRLEAYRGKTFFVYHPAFAYFAARYGLHEHAVEQEGKAPGPRTLAALVREAEGAKVLFVQPQYDKQALETIVAAIGAKVETLDPLAYDLLENYSQLGERIAGALEGQATNE